MRRVLWQRAKEIPGATLRAKLPYYENYARCKAHRAFSFAGGDAMADYPDFEERCGYGDILGICGVNCRHSFHPFIPGVMERTYSDAELENIDPPPFEYEGKTYSHYEATQKQRQIETAVRRWKRRAAAATNDEDKQAAMIRVRRLNEKYEEFSKAADLRMQKERMNMYAPKG